MGGKLVFDFFYIIRNVILLLERVLGGKQPGEHFLQRYLIAVQIHVNLGDSARGFSSGTLMLLLQRWALEEPPQENTHKHHENKKAFNKHTLYGEP